MASKKLPIFEMRIELEGVSPSVWRSFRVDPMVTLPMLHLILQYVMGWKNYHLHAFEIEGKCFGPPGQDCDDRWLDESRYRLRSLTKEPGDFFTYTYDFGDHWKHRVVMEGTIGRSRSVRHPLCTGGQNACPPEDVGGVPGYSRLRMILANPGLKEHDEMIRWLGNPFDPGKFDLRYQNMSMWNLRGTTLPPWARAGYIG